MLIKSNVKRTYDLAHQAAQQHQQIVREVRVSNEAAALKLHLSCCSQNYLHPPDPLCWDHNLMADFIQCG